MGRLLRGVYVTLIASCVFSCGAPHAEQRRSPCPSLATRVADTWMEGTAADALRWNWRDGVLVYGLWRLSEQTRCGRCRAYVHSYMQHHLASGIRVRWSDHTTPALTAAELVLAGEPRFRPLVGQVVDYIMNAPRTPRQGWIRHTGDRIPGWLAPRFLPDIWIDSLFHVVPTLMRYTEITGDPRYAREAVRQLLGFARHLQDPRSGLFTHGYNDDARGGRVPPLERGLFWARGNGWMLVTLVDVLSRLPADHAAREELAQRMQRQVQALLQAQDRQGMFHTLLCDPTTYLETAGSALIAYGLAQGAQAGLLGDRARAAAQRAMHGLIAQVAYDGPRALITGTSLGTNPIAFRYRRIRQRAQVSYGVGAWLLAASALPLRDLPTGL